MSKILLVIVFLSGITFTSIGQDYPLIAKESCDCFKKSKDTMSVEFRQLLIRVTQQKDIKVAFSSAMDSLPDARIQTYFDQLGALGDEMGSEDTQAGSCLLGIAQKYSFKKYEDNPQLVKEFTIKLSHELRKNKDCELLAAIYLYAMAMYE